MAAMLLCFTGPALADDSSQQLAARHAAIKLRPSYQHCLDATGGVTPDMKECMSVEFAFQDKRLNIAYKRLMSPAAPEAKAALRTEERAWIKHKDAQCAPDLNGGQAAELVAYDCLVVETARRATELEDRR